MNEKEIGLLERDLEAIPFQNSEFRVANIIYTDRFRQLIREWIRSRAMTGPILVAEYLLFKNDIKDMLIAEMRMINNSGQSEIWLIKEVFFM